MVGIITFIGNVNVAPLIVATMSNSLIYVGTTLDRCVVKRFGFKVPAETLGTGEGLWRLVLEMLFNVNVKKY